MAHPEKYITIEINFGDGKHDLCYSLDERPIDATVIATCFEHARDAALSKLAKDGTRAALAAVLGRKPTEDEVALAMIGRGPLDALVLGEHDPQGGA